MISISQSGGFKNFDNFVKNTAPNRLYGSLGSIAQAGVNALRQYTPVDSGLTADSWIYDIDVSKSECVITWSNTNTINGYNVAIGLQYGHGTGTGGWVRGYDYINPAIRPIFDELADRVWKVVTDA